MWRGAWIAGDSGMRVVCLSVVLLGLNLGAVQAQDPTSGASQALDPNAPVGQQRAALPNDLSRVAEDPLLGPGRTPAIVAVGDRQGRVHPRRDPLIVVHGIKADFGDVAPLVRELGGQTRYQVHVVAYADLKRRTSLNGDDVARLLCERFAGRPLTFVAHSMGGIVVRRALNRLTVEGRIGAFPSVRVLAVDTPWHGYGGPRDGLRMGFVRPFMPDGYEDMRARSPMFAGDERKDDALDRAGLYGVELPASVRIHVVVAQRGDAALDYTELPRVPGQLARRLDLEPFEADVDVQTRHFTTALAQSEVGRAIVAGDVPLTPLCVGEALARLAPRLPGDHASVLATPEFMGALRRFLGLGAAN